jgi:superfamily II DNA or RNA helicase
MDHGEPAARTKGDEVNEQREWPATPWTLRPYQVEALRRISAAWRDGHQRTMLVLATGLGKTTCFAEVARRRTAAGRKPTLVLAHRIELIDQAAERLRLAGLTVAIETGEQRASMASLFGETDAVIATVQTLRAKRLEKWAPDAFDTVVCDEAHHAAAAGYRAILDRFTGAMHLGVTATPDRGDSIAIGHVYPHLAYSYGIREGVTDGFLVPIRQLAIDTPSLDMSSVRTTKQEHGRDLNPADLAAAMRGEKELHELAAPIAREAGKRPTLVFVPSVEIAHALASVLAGYVGAHAVRSLDGNSDSATRESVIADFKEGRVQILVNCALFTEGFDAPATACVAIARPTKSRSLYAQMVGRGTRLHPGKEDLLVLNLRPDVIDHSLVSVVDLFAGDELPDDVAAEIAASIARGEPVLASISKAEAASRAREEARARERGKARIVADVKYRRYEQDPFGELGIDGPTARDSSGPRATDGQASWLTKAGFAGAAALSRREASRILDELGRRRERGLCTIKQMRVLAKQGLRTDLTFAEAGDAITAVKENGWRMSPEIADRFGA